MPPYRSIDHLMLRLPAAEALFDLFSRVFELPVAWPLQHAAFATYGWVHVGNTDLELWAAASNGDLPDHAQPPLVHGFALEPALPLHAAMAQTTALGIQCKPARRFESTDEHGQVVTNFSNSALLDLSSPSCCVFFCEWGAGARIYPWTENATPVQRRVRLGQDLHHAGGGPLGLQGLRTIRMASPDLQAHQRCGMPGHAEHGIALTPDTRLDLVAGEHLHIEALGFGVRSLAQARAFLSARQLLVADTGNALQLRAEGLHIRLTQETAADRQA